MQKLVKGVHRFQSEIFTGRKRFFEQLSQGQSPDALFITCSDSRINPNLITQTEPGELFILRNAGNIVPPYGAAHGGEEATIEYAVSVLGIKNIIICGHSLCGAMKGLLNPDSLTDLPAVQRWLRHAESTQRIVRENYAELSGEELLIATVEENVLTQLENISTHPVVSAGLKRGELYLHGWVYKFQTGQVFSYDPEEGQFMPLSEASRPMQPMVSSRRADGMSI